MKINWEINELDINKVKSFYDVHRENDFVIIRKEKNINKIGINLSNESHWIVLISCLLTTQQRSGPNSKVNNFLSTKPFPLSLNECLDAKSLGKFCESKLKLFGGIRRSETIGKELENNLAILRENNWNLISEINAELQNSDKYKLERKWSLLLSDKLMGIGPKQSRNYLQMLGLTKYETPLDSRIMKWLNEFGFPVHLSAAGLADHQYYNFVMDGFRALCLKSDIYPCLMDAAIFSSFDEGGWTRENSVF